MYIRIVSYIGSRVNKILQSHIMYIFQSSGSIPEFNAFFGRGRDEIYLDDLDCNGTEADLLTCPIVPTTTHSCSHSDDAGVRCGG